MAIVLPNPTHAPRSLEEITSRIEVYPPSFRRWCDAPEQGGCACGGCVRWPAPSTVRGDPEGKAFPGPATRLSKEEVAIYLASLRAEDEAPYGYCLDHGDPHPCGSCGQGDD